MLPSELTEHYTGQVSQSLWFIAPI